MTNLTERVQIGRRRKDRSGQFRAAAGAWVGLVLLGGCSFAPKYSVPPVQTPPAFKETEGWKLAQPKDDLIRGKWWEMFNDPGTERARRASRCFQSDARGRPGQFSAARAVVKEARSQYFPTVSAAPSVTKSTRRPPSNLLREPSAGPAGGHRLFVAAGRLVGAGFVGRDPEHRQGGHVQRPGQRRQSRKPALDRPGGSGRGLLFPARPGRAQGGVGRHRGC